MTKTASLPTNEACRLPAQRERAVMRTAMRSRSLAAKHDGELPQSSHFPPGCAAFLFSLAGLFSCATCPIAPPRDLSLEPARGESATVSPIDAAAPTSATSTPAVTSASGASSASGATRHDSAHPLPVDALRGKCLVPSPLAEWNSASAPPKLDAFNRWATEAGLDANLAAWVSLGLPRSQAANTSLEIRFNSSEAPSAATATQIHDGLLDDSVRAERIVIEFSRKPCRDCAPDSFIWSATSVAITHSCQKGRGHAEFSQQPCI